MVLGLTGGHSLTQMVENTSYDSSFPLVLASLDPLPKQAASISCFHADSGPTTPQCLAAGEAHRPSHSLSPVLAWGALCSAAPASHTPAPAHVLFMPLSHLSNYTEG